MHVYINLLVKVNIISLAGKANSALLVDGTLYVANMGSGKWVPIING